MSYDNCIEYLFGENMLKLDKIYDAKNILSKIARVTNLVESKFLSTSNHVYLKSENLQLTGSFKLRGAYYKIAKLSQEEKNNGMCLPVHRY